MTIKRMASSAIAPSIHHKGLPALVSVVSVRVCLVVVEVLVCAGGLLCVVVVVLVFCATALRANGARPRVKAIAIALTIFVRLKDFTALFSFSKRILEADLAIIYLSTLT
jgi:hypothetical protein